MQQSLAIINFVIVIKKKYGALSRAVFISSIKCALGLTNVLCVEISNCGHLLQRHSCYFIGKYE
jgi:hypothetical protein